MIRPFTCLTLVAACGAGLYLYQVKHRAQMVDRDITRTVKLTEQTRDRISLLKTELASLTTSARLSQLATEHLQLQTPAPAQFVRLEDLRSRLPAVAIPSATPVPLEEPPIAAVTPPAPIKPSSPPLPMLAMIQPQHQPAVPVPALVKQFAPVFVRPPQIAAPIVNVAAAVKVSLPTLPVAPVQVAPVQIATVHSLPKPAPAHVLVAGLTKPKEPEPREVAVKEPPVREPPAREPAVHEPAVAPHRLFAPVMPAYAPTPVVVHAPTVQTASATVSQSAPFVGSALGMAHTVLAAPVPVQSSYPSSQ